MSNQITLADIVEVLQKNLVFYNDPNTPRKVEIKERMAARHVKKEVPELDSVFATGYPNYILPYGYKHPKIQEIWRYTEMIFDRASALLDLEKEGIYQWPCASHLAQIPDAEGMVAFCKGCEYDSAELDPHTICETLFDMDLLFVVDGNPEEIGPKVFAAMAKKGYHPYERDLVTAFQEYPGRLSVDMNVISRKQFWKDLDTFSKFEDGSWVTFQGDYYILWGKKPRWRKIFFGTDMVLTLNDMLVSSNTQEKIFNARKRFARTHSFEEASEHVIQAHKEGRSSHLRRLAELLTYPLTHAAIRRNWGALFNNPEYIKLNINGLASIESQMRGFGGDNLNYKDHLCFAPEIKIERLKEIAGLPEENLLINYVVPLAMLDISPRVRKSAWGIIENVVSGTSYTLSEIYELALNREFDSEIRKTIENCSDNEQITDDRRYPLLSKTDINKYHKRKIKRGSVLFEIKHGIKLQDVADTIQTQSEEMQRDYEFSLPYEVIQ